MYYIQTSLLEVQELGSFTTKIGHTASSGTCAVWNSNCPLLPVFLQDSMLVDHVITIYVIKIVYNLRLVFICKMLNCSEDRTVFFQISSDLHLSMKINTFIN